MADQTEIDQAHNVVATIQDGFKNFTYGNHYSYKHVGNALNVLKNKALYKALGFKTFDEALKSIGKSRSICYAMMDYDDVIAPLADEYPQINDIPVTMLTKDVVPLIREAQKNGGDLSVLVNKLLELSVLDEPAQRDEIRGMRGKAKMVDCAHSSTELWVKCRDCHKFIGPANKT